MDRPCTSRVCSDINFVQSQGIWLISNCHCCSFIVRAFWGCVCNSWSIAILFVTQVNQGLISLTKLSLELGKLNQNQHEANIGKHCEYHWNTWKPQVQWGLQDKWEIHVTKENAKNEEYKGYELDKPFPFWNGHFFFRKVLEPSKCNNQHDANVNEQNGV